MWQWEGDIAGQFHPYAVEVASLIEKAYRCGAHSVDLNRHPFYFPYIVKLSSMVQIRTTTNYRRRVRRVQLPQPYVPSPSAASSFLHASALQFSAPVFQPSNASSPSVPSLNRTGPFPVVAGGTFQFSAGIPSGFYIPSLLIPAFGFTQSPTSSAVLSAGSAQGGLGIGGGSSGAIVNVSPTGGTGNSGDQKPLFTIGKPSPSSLSDTVPKRKRSHVRGSSSGSRQVGSSERQRRIFLVCWSVSK